MNKPTGKLAFAYASIGNLECRIDELMRQNSALAAEVERLSVAQDERDLFKQYRLAGEFCVSRGIDDDSEIRPKILDAFCSGYACADRHMHTEAAVSEMVEALKEARHHVVISLDIVRGGLIQEIDDIIAAHRNQGGGA